MNRSREFTIGLSICVVLGLLDLVGLAGINMDAAPPAPVVIGGGILGLITLVGAYLAWGGRRGGLAAVVGSRVLSAFLGGPAFFDDGAPDWARVVVAIAIALTVVAIGLLYGARRQPTASAAASMPPGRG